MATDRRDKPCLRLPKDDPLTDDALRGLLDV
jgi:hypothetical protein